MNHCYFANILGESITLIFMECKIEYLLDKEKLVCITSAVVALVSE